MGLHARRAVAPGDTSGYLKSAELGGHNALRAAICRQPVPPPAARSPSPRPPAGGGDARRGGARIHDGEGAGRDGRREDGRVRPVFRWTRAGGLPANRECEGRGLRHRGRRCLRAE